VPDESIHTFPGDSEVAIISEERSPVTVTRSTVEASEIWKLSSENNTHQLHPIRVSHYYNHRGQEARPTRGAKQCIKSYPARDEGQEMVETPFVNIRRSLALALARLLDVVRLPTSWPSGRVLVKGW
jgi:hypothetical protein